MSHFIEKCMRCNATVRQCRCPDKNKVVNPVICVACAADEDADREMGIDDSLEDVGCK